jgi:hypothetical protein
MWQIVHLIIERSGIRSIMSYWTVSIVDVACKVVPIYEFMVSQNINSTLLTKFKSNIYLLNKRSQLITVK